MMLILISLVPASFALNPEISRASIRADIRGLQENFSDPSWAAYPQTPAIQQKIDSLSLLLDDVQAPAIKIRAEILHLQKDIKNIQNLSFVPQAGANFDATSLSQHTKNLYDTIDYAPWWVIALISISLGIGTMFGWKRIVKTLGKKIGNHKMSYAESTSSALITAITITVASRF